MSGSPQSVGAVREPPSRAARSTQHAALLLVLALAVIALVVKGATVAAAVGGTFAFPFQVDDAEGVLLAEAALIAGGTNPYALQPSPAPYFHAGPYPPLYTLVNTAAFAALGPTFKVGRAVQLLATLGVGVWLAWAVARSARAATGTGAGRVAWSGWLVGAWAALLWLSAHLVAVWAVLVRPDMTALLFNLLGVAALREYLSPLPPAPQGERGRGGAVVLAAGCFALGWWTKQTFIMVPLAVLVVLVWSRPRAAVTLGAIYAALIAVPGAAFTLATGGGFAQKIIGYQGSWEWTAFRRLAEPFALRYGPLLLFALGVAAVFTVRRRGPTFVAVWFALAAVAALAAGTSGGNHNHFVELLAASALLVGQGVAGGLADAGDRRARLAGWAAVGAMVLLTGVSLTEQEGQRGWLAREYTAPTATQAAGYRAVADYLANTPGPVYSDNVGILVVARQPVRVTDPFTMAAAVRLGRWDDAQLVADVAAGQYPAIALRCYMLDAEKPPTDATPALIRAVQSRYRLAERNVLCVYVPK